MLDKNRYAASPPDPTRSSTRSGESGEASPAEAAVSPAGVHTIGRYRIVRRVGVGGMAQVFLGSTDGPEGSTGLRAIKRILPELSRDEQFAKMFVTEARVAAMLDHPNIVHVFDFAIEDGDYYLVMEYVAGASLANVLRAKRRRGVPLGAPIAAEVGAAVAHALAYAHAFTLPDGQPLELVHRDISPGNILISHDGDIKLADFGVVKTSLSSAAVGVVNGKWAYMAPEQIMGQTVDQRSDLFSLGIVLHECITGIRLFRARSAAETASRVLDARIPPPSSVVPDLDPRLDRVVMKLLEREPERRHPSAAALASELDAIRASPPFVAGRARLRTLVTTLFPEEIPGRAREEAPAVALLAPAGLAASRRDAGQAQGEIVSGVNGAALPATHTPPPARREISVKLLFGLAVGAACALASLVFLLLVL